MNPSEDTLNLGATLPRTQTETAAEAGTPELELLHTIKVAGSGTLVFNRYRLQKVLGRGGMGVVWLAEDTKLDRQVALKFLPDIIGADPVAVKELKDETRRGLDLAHPNIVRIYDFVDDEEAAAISMEYVNGKSLSEMRLSQPHHIFSVHDLAPWVAQMCDALDYAHLQRRIVHRDLKPANLMVNSESQVKITDFGIARSVSDTMSRLSMMRANTSGTLLYMSPQQAMGDRPKPTDDIYSVGATLYELLTGKPPFYSGDISMQITAKNAPSVRQRREELEVQAVDDVPKDWEEAIADCLNKDPAKRPQTAGELARRLGLATRTDAVLGGVRVKTDGPKSIEVRTDRVPAVKLPEMESSRKSWGLVAAAVAVLGLAGVAGGAWWWMNRPADYSLDIEPKGALVSMAGHTRPAPARFEGLKPGHYLAKITAEGYEPRTLDVSLSAGQKLVAGKVQLERSQGELLLSSDPDGVPFEVRLSSDEKAPKTRGETPQKLRLPVGTYTVTMRHPSELKTVDIEVTRNGEHQQAFTFARPTTVEAPVLIATPPAPAPPPSSPAMASTEAPPTPGPEAPAPGPSPTTTSEASPLPPVAMAPAGSVTPQAPGSPAVAGSPTAPPTPPLPPAAPSSTTPTPVTPPPDGYWNIDQIFTGSAFHSYSRNGRAYLLYEAQAALKQRSHYKSSVDGKVGQGTHKAIVSFQSANGLQPTGQLDDPTITALGLSTIDDKADWTVPQRKRSTRSSGGGDDDEPGWWRTNVADPFKRAFRR